MQNSANALIDRKKLVFQEASRMLEQLFQIHRCLPAKMALGFLKKFLDHIRGIGIQLSQMLWAVNSNSEHVKYVARTYALPETFKSVVHDPCTVNIKKEIFLMVQESETMVRLGEQYIDRLRSITMVIFLSSLN